MAHGRLRPVLEKQSILNGVALVQSTFGAGEVGLVGAGALAMARDKTCERAARGAASGAACPYIQKGVGKDAGILSQGN